MIAAFIVLLLFPLAQADTGGTAAAQAGKVLWEGPNTACRNCHGNKGEGGYGPDLAGRQLSVEQFRQAIRKPWGVMPAYTDQQLSDPDVAQLVAYFSSLPKVAEPAAWRTPTPPGAKTGQTLMIANAGCGQCHGAALGIPRAVAGGIGADFEWFKKMVYEHTTTMQRGDGGRLHMGNYSTTRLPESLLQEIWHYASVEVGLRVPVRARVSTGMPAGNNVTYTVTVENTGTPGKGPTAQDLSISLQLPPGATVVTGGAGYQGTSHDQKANADVAVWQLPRLAPAETQTYMLTLSGTGAGGGIARGTVGWSKPTLADGSPDQVLVVLPPRSPQTQ